MKTLLLVAALLLFTSFAFTFPQSKPVQWEYKFEYQCKESTASKLGVEGWELVSVAPGSGNNLFQICAFKRPK